jgi:phospholipase C
MKRFITPISSALIAAAVLSPVFAGANGSTGNSPTATPIKHLVVIFQENVSFDHYRMQRTSRASRDSSRRPGRRR